MNDISEREREMLAVRLQYQNECFELACKEAGRARFVWRVTALTTLICAVGLALVPGAWTIGAVIASAFITWRAAHRASRAFDETQHCANLLTHTRMLLRQHGMTAECYSDGVRVSEETDSTTQGGRP